MRKKRKLAAVTREAHEEHPRNGQSQDMSVPRINEEYITQNSEEIEGRITENCPRSSAGQPPAFWVPCLNEMSCVLKPQIRTHSATVPGTFRNTNVENQGTNEDDSQSYPHPEGDTFRSQTTQNSDPEVGHDMVRSVQRRGSLRP